MSNYLLTDETRRHRLAEFNRILPLLRENLKYVKQLLKEKQRLKTYEQHKEKLEDVIQTADKLANNKLFSFDSTQSESFQERAKELEDELKKTEEFVFVFESSIDDLENKVLYYENFIYNTLRILSDDIEPILNEEEINSKDIKEYCYLIFVLETKEFHSWFHRKSLLTVQYREYIKKIMLNDEELAKEDIEQIVRLLKMI